jgi:hypothetical protein
MRGRINPPAKSMDDALYARAEDPAIEHLEFLYRSYKPERW